MRTLVGPGPSANHCRCETCHGPFCIAGQAILKGTDHIVLGYKLERPRAACLTEYLGILARPRPRQKAATSADDQAHCTWNWASRRSPELESTRFPGRWVFAKGLCVMTIELSQFTVRASSSTLQTSRGRYIADPDEATGRRP